MVSQRDFPEIKQIEREQPAIIYARVSSREQEREGCSIDAQLKLLREYAVRGGFKVLHEVVDVETAKRTGRSGFTRMVSLLAKDRKAGDAEGRCRTILTEKTDRLYRNLRDWVTIDELDLEIHLVKENVVMSPTSRSAERFMHGIKVLMAKNYIDNLREEVRKGMDEKAAQGYFPSRAPLGYVNVLTPEGKKTIEPDSDMAPLIIALYEWYATGEHSLKEATVMARDAGLAFRNSGSSLPKSSVHRILRNPIYMGQVEWKGRRDDGKHTPIVSRELWERVQKVFEQRLATRHKKSKHDLPFARLLTCGHCGRSIVGEIKKGR